MNKTTNKLNGRPSVSPKGDWISALTLVMLLMLAFVARAQEGGQGNTTIFGGAEMTFFGNYDFTVGGGGAQPGVILTQRETNNFGVLNFLGTNLITTGADNANYVDGYVRKYGAGPFIFPVGDNDYVGQFAASSADSVMGAYFRADPNVAITTNRFTGGNYTSALPAGAPFSTTLKANNVGKISTTEYWDINGPKATPITLTWSATSAIQALTAGTLTHLIIVGWNGTQWVKIPSTVDVNSVLTNTASTLTAGSITTNAAIIPNTYTAYTFGTAPVDLTPTITMPSNNFAANNTTKNLAVTITELLGVVTGDSIQFSITVPPGYTINFNPTQTTITPSGSAVPLSLNNAQWTIISTALSGRKLNFRSNAGVTIAALGKAILGFTVTRVSAQPGSVASITVNVVNDPTLGAYDTVNANNIYVRGINAL